MKIVFAVDTLEYLRRGGRIGAAQAWVGSALKIKPILTIEREILPLERVRTAGRAFERLTDELQRAREGGADVFVIQHIQAPDVAERLAERGREIYGRDPEVVSELGPVFGAHIGPGLVGVTGSAELVAGPGVTGTVEQRAAAQRRVLAEVIWIAAATGIASSAPSTPNSVEPNRTEVSTIRGSSCTAFAWMRGWITLFSTC